MGQISFHSHSLNNDHEKKYDPSPAKTSVPRWFASADRNWKDPHGNVMKNSYGGNSLSFKSCPALLDTFTSGYVLNTPCDIEFVKVGDVTIPKTPEGYETFCEIRGEMPGLEVPYGHSKSGYHWYPNWGIELPEGYSALCISPINHFELPFTTMGGIIDSDKTNTPGLVPFFIREGFTGKISAGTPYLQIIPIKREDWFMDKIYYTYAGILKRHQKQANDFRVPEGGAYKKHFWQRKRYE